MKNIQESFNEIVKGIEQDHVALFMVSPEGATCTIIHVGDRSEEKCCAKDLLRVATNNYLSVMEGDFSDHEHAAHEAEIAFDEIITEYKEEYDL